MTEENNKSLVEGIFPDNCEYRFEESEVEIPEWEPWHKPRKQWLRDNQWNKEIGNLVDRLRLESRPLHYLSLPGGDLLDFRMVTELCDFKQVNVKLVGFNDLSRSAKSNTELLATKNQVFSHSVVAPSSDIHFDDFNKISDTDSIAHKFADEKGPYDIINLDLCSSFSGTIESESYYKAALNLFNLQIQFRNEPWVFLLTTRSDQGEVNQNDFENFWNNIRDNAVSSEEFKTGLENDFLAGNYDSIEDSISNIKDLPSPNYEKFFGLCVSKWLLRLIGSSGSWTAKLLDSYWYRTKSAGNSHPNMLSLAFLFEPIQTGLQDPSGLVSADMSGREIEVYDETSLAIDMLDKINDLTDVDQHLHENQEDFDEAIAGSERLLEKAGYEVASYRDWAIGVLPTNIANSGN